jgi:hypothetical protein
MTGSLGPGWPPAVALDRVLSRRSAASDNSHVHLLVADACSRSERLRPLVDGDDRGLVREELLQ